MQPPQTPERNRLELGELLDSLSSSGKHAEDIESDLIYELAHLLTKFYHCFLPIDWSKIYVGDIQSCSKVCIVQQ